MRERDGAHGNSRVALAGQVETVIEDWGTLQWLVSGHRGQSATMTLGRVTIRTGKANPHHVHPNCDEALFVVAGNIDHTLEKGGLVRLGPGDAIVIPKGIWHHAVNVGPMDAVVLVAFDSAWRETIGESAAKQEVEPS